MFPYILGAGLGTDILPQQAETKTEEPALVAENSPDPTFSNSLEFPSSFGKTPLQFIKQALNSSNLLALGHTLYPTEL